MDAGHQVLPGEQLTLPEKVGSAFQAPQSELASTRLGRFEVAAATVSELVCC